MVKLTKSKIKEMIKDELKSAKTYRKFGLTNLAVDESKHRKYLLKLQRRI
jgi:hypothetical protein